MKQAIRALGFAIYILWLVIIVFTATALYSALQLGIELGEAKMTASEDAMILLLPFSIKNKGFYDISDLNITTILIESDEVLVANSTLVPLISAGSKVSAIHYISVSLENVASTSLSRLLFYDTEVDFDLSLALKFAHVISIEISTNSTMDWGAPLYNLVIGDIASEDYNATHIRAMVPISFENHSFFNLDGTLRTELVNAQNQKVGGSTTSINAPSQYAYSTEIEVYVPIDVSDLKEVRLYFDTSVFSYGPQVIPIG